ncbi:Ig-like domain-containing protein [Butyrivibrio sp. INlla16]|uniref:Ig-like domain-containing protein n=1 Tax=Butyrivibrio sp. INlla16 TaxID=1520807 RepID=UPI00088426CB|nr:Ig-like domain-containing protein [Butyrivibrio sp. INlla16]SDB47590.1 copper-binding protein (NosD) [Butyrivibrio sp. INlla16]
MIKKKRFISLILAAALAMGQFGVTGTNVRAEEGLQSVTDGNAASENEDKAEGEQSTSGLETEQKDADENTDDAEAKETLADDTEDATEDTTEDITVNDDAGEDENLEVSDGNADTSEENKEEDPHTYTTEFDYEDEVDGFGITIHADKGVLPDGVTVTVRHLSEDEEKELSGAINDKCNDSLFYSSSFDISFFDEENNEVQPKDGDVKVSFDVSRDMVAEADGCGVSDITVMHFDDDSECSPVKAENEEENADNPFGDCPDTEVYHDEDGNLVDMPMVLNSHSKAEHTMSVSFDADSFSVYSLVLAATYTFEPEAYGTEQIIELNDADALMNDFDDYVQQAFTYAAKNASANEKYRVRLPQNGKYTLVKPEKALRLGSNTTFDLNGSYILNERCWGMIIGAKGAADDKSGYGGFKNMAIVNGTIDANAFSFSDQGFVTVKFAHITGLTIENVAFPNSRGHSIEIAAAKDVKVNRCSFEHYTYPGSPNDEAVNIDAAHEDWISLGSDSDPTLMGPFDDYCCMNVEVSNCTFNDVYRAIGSHNSIVGHHHKNITIHDNLISNITNHAIGCPHYVDSKIYNNMITNVGRGIDSVVEGYAIAEADDKNSSDENFNANLEITGNTITMGTAINTGYPYGIRVGGMLTNGSTEIDNGTYYTSGYHITGNTLEGFEAGVYIRYARGSEINNNAANNCKNGYDVTNASEINTFYANKVNNSTETGILVRDYSKIFSTDGNEVITNADEPISVQEGASAVFYLDPKYVLGIGEAIMPRFYCGENEVTFTSSKKSAVKVTKAGKLKSKKKANVVVTATQDGCTASIKVKSKKAPKLVKLPKKKTIKKGNTYQLNPKVNSGAACNNYKFKSDNKKIVKVTSTGLVKARKKGRAIITVTAYNGVKSTIVINVK